MLKAISLGTLLSRAAGTSYAAQLGYRTSAATHDLREFLDLDSRQGKEPAFGELARAMMATLVNVCFLVHGSCDEHAFDIVAMCATSYLCLLF